MSFLFFCSGERLIAEVGPGNEHRHQGGVLAEGGARQPAIPGPAEEVIR